MSSNLVNYTWKEIDELQAIRKYFNVEEEMFSKGYSFAQLVIDGVNKVKSYEQAFGVDKEFASRNAGSFMTRKWVRELIRSIKVDDDTLYIGEVKKIIDRGMQIVNNPKSSNRDVTEAMKALQPYIKQQTQRVEANILVQDANKPIDAMMDKIQDGIKLLQSNGKMFNEEGNIIDVKPIL